MQSVEQSIEVNVPVSTAYNQWTQFEEFPRFMEGVEAVTQLDNQRLQWRANVGGPMGGGGAGFPGQHPDGRLSSKRTKGAPHPGGVKTEEGHSGLQPRPIYL